MNIKHALIAEHSKLNAIAIARYAVSSPERFRELMNLYFSEDRILSQRAAWSVGKAAELLPELFQTYLPKLIRLLTATGKHGAVARCASKVLVLVNIPQHLHGEVMTKCFSLIEDPNTAIAVKANAMHIMEKLARTYPEIIGELKAMVEAMWDNETAAFRARGKSILKM